jgi:hypothetical protein
MKKYFFKSVIEYLGKIGDPLIITYKQGTASVEKYQLKN